jgi:hypothetical protein
MKQEPYKICCTLPLSIPSSPFTPKGCFKCLDQLLCSLGWSSCPFNWRLQLCPISIGFLRRFRLGSVWGFKRKCRIQVEHIILIRLGSCRDLSMAFWGDTSGYQSFVLEAPIAVRLNSLMGPQIFPYDNLQWGELWITRVIRGHEGQPVGNLWAFHDGVW